MPSTPDTLIVMGYQARKESRLTDAKRLFSQAIESCREAADLAGLAKSLTGLGQIERDLGSNGAALQHYREAADIYRGLPEPLRLAHTIRHVGDILRHQGSIEEARPCYEEALAIYRKHDETPDLDLANTIKDFALLREHAGEPEQARSLWQEAKGLYEAANVQAGVQQSDARLHLLAKT